ncbi:MULTISPECIES: IclR family transcriptional regulator [unclassified Novosphingobium]|uniref:IclR family transcriptional regulator n=1 Tax=unclassified Novosphingobium TaxID=2644732 RepID=UPI0013581241|nr:MULTISPECIES: IclR family transcriptional regulator [unclassified Novosphingobium]
MVKREQDESQSNSKSGVAAVDRAFTILGAFTHEQPVQSLAEIAQNTGLYKSTILRLLGSLEGFGYIRQMTDGNYQLGPKLAVLSSIFQDAFDLRDYVEPVLKEVVNQTQEGVSFLIRDGDTQLCLFRQDGRQAVRDYHIRVGTRLTFDSGASARIFRKLGDTANLPRPLPRYFAISRGEVNGEMAAISAPIFGARNELVGALQISSPIARFGDDRVELLKTVGTEASVALSIALGMDPDNFSTDGHELQG